MTGRRTRDTAGRRRSSWGCATAVVVVVLLVLTGAGLWLVRQANTPAEATNRCTAVTDGTSWELSVEQADDAALIAVTSMQRGMPARAATIGLATALQESRLINIDYGDRDSVGLFQQRPSQGWGTVEQIMDPVYSTGRFYDGLAAVEGYTELEVTEAAQAVQRSAFPDAYAQHEIRARAWASALTGWSEAALTCDLPASAGSGSAEDFVQRVNRDFGGSVTATVDGGSDGSRVLLESAALAAVSGAEQQRVDWAVAQWAVAVAAGQQVNEVAVGSRVWDRTGHAWLTATDRGSEQAAGTVAVTLATVEQ